MEKFSGAWFRPCVSPAVLPRPTFRADPPRSAAQMQAALEAASGYRLIEIQLSWLDNLPISQVSIGLGVPLAQETLQFGAPVNSRYHLVSFSEEQLETVAKIAREVLEAKLAERRAQLLVFGIVP